ALPACPRERLPPPVFEKLAMRLSFVTWLLLGAIGALPAEASAQQPEEEEEAAADEPRVRFQRGVELSRQGDFAAALTEFRASFEMRRNPAVRYNIGLCHLALEQLVDARRELRLYLVEVDPARVSQERRSEVEGILARIESSVALLDISASILGAEIRVDGRAVGVAPLPEPIAVMPGDHEVSVTAEGREAYSERLTVAGGERRALAAVLREAAPSRPPVPPRPEEPLVSDRGLSTSTPGMPVPPRPEEPLVGADEGLSQVWFWTAVGAAGALAVGGAIAGGIVESRRSEFDDAVSRYNSGADLDARAEGAAIKSEGEDLALATNVLLAAAGAAAATALVLAFFTEFGSGAGPEEPPVTLGLGPTADDGASAVTGVMFDISIKF
ncbi:MAG: PEGA domain-containing protein, partial [Myxococcota bacterium]|nr:PEGA domain-containing protein [Myxococcota bacterium]